MKMFIFILLASSSSYANTCENYLNSPRITQVEQLSPEQLALLEDLAHFELEARKLTDPHLKRVRFIDVSERLAEIDLSSIEFRVYYEVLEAIRTGVSQENKLTSIALERQNESLNSVEKKEKEEASKLEHLLNRKYWTNSITEALFGIFQDYDYETVGKRYVPRILKNSFLRNKINISEALSSGMTLLHLAAQKNNYLAVQTLLKLGADATSQDHSRQTPLSLAVATAKNSRVAKLLLDHGSNIEARDIDGHTPLHSATYSHFAKIAEFLIRQGADIESKDYFDMTPLIFAVKNGNFDVAKLLLDKNANQKARDKQKRTALHHALREGYSSIAKLLVERGSDIHTQDDKGKTPLKLAIEGNLTDVEDLLRQHGAIK